MIGLEMVGHLLIGISCEAGKGIVDIDLEAFVASQYAVTH